MAKLEVGDIVQRLQQVCDSSEFVALHEPLFAGNEWKFVKECIDTGWVSSVGSYVDLFEEKLASYCGVARAVAVVNGTAALHVCLVLSGVERDDEILIPALTFIATANAVSYCGAVPHFVDSEFRTLGVDAIQLGEYLSDISEIREGTCFNKKTGRRIKAVVPMHAFGHPVDLDELVKVCDAFHLTLIEDAAESLGSFYKGQHTGSIGSLSALSFNGNKIVTTGGGGAILTNNVELGKLAKHITTTAKVPHRWLFEHDMVAYNYRLPNINAALGCAQVEQLPSFIERKRNLASHYASIFEGCAGVRFFKEPEFARSNYWLNVLLLDEKEAANRDSILQQTNDIGIMTRPSWTLMNQLEMFKNCPHMDLKVAESISKRLINIPSSVKLGSTDA